MAAPKPLQLLSGLTTEVAAVETSAGAADADKLVALGAAGTIDPTMFPAGIGQDIQLITASANLAAGDLVNIHVSSGTKVRKADASVAAAGQRADGFVLAAVLSGAVATVYPRGANTSVSGLTAGLTYVLSDTTPGGLLPLSGAPTTAGRIQQVVGRAVSATIIEIDIQDPVVRG